VLQYDVLNGLVIDLKKVDPMMKAMKNMDTMAANDLDQIVMKKKAAKKMDTMAVNDLGHHVQKEMDLGKDV
jgi:hypothetical protein